MIVRSARTIPSRSETVTIKAKVLSLFSFPDPVNETSARIVAGTVALIAIAMLISHEPLLLPVLAYGFTARALTGPKLSPLALTVTRLITPRLPIRHRYAPGPAKRFAQAIGAVITIAATLFYFAAGMHTVAFALVAILAVFALAEALLGLCVGCRAFYSLMRLGLIPESVCERCITPLRIGGLDGAGADGR